MSGHPPQRTAAEIYRTTPKWLWLATETHVGAVYPCRCRGDCDPKWCPCWGRTDRDPLAARCCVERHPNHRKDQP